MPSLFARSEELPSLLFGSEFALVVPRENVTSPNHRKPYTGQGDHFSHENPTPPAASVLGLHRRGLFYAATMRSDGRARTLVGLKVIGKASCVPDIDDPNGVSVLRSRALVCPMPEEEVGLIEGKESSSLLIRQRTSGRSLRSTFLSLRFLPRLDGMRVDDCPD